MSDTAVFVLVVALFVVSAVLAFGIEPHWSTRDGTTFIARATRVEHREQSRWVEVRGWVREGRVELRARRSRNTAVGGWYDVTQVVDGARRTSVFHLTGDHDVALRVPRRSRTATALGILLAGSPHPAERPED
ncbi:MAG: hypothetical protein ACKOCE_10725 [Acidimicrobiia bacterium]